MVTSAINIVLAIFVMLGVGMALYKMGWIHDGNTPFLSKLVVKLALPAMIVNNLFTNFDRAGMLEALRGIAAPYLSILLCVPVALLCALAFKLPKGRRGVFSACFLFSNSVFIGVPVSTALFGDGVMPYTLMYYIANTSLFWSLAVFLMEKDAQHTRVQPKSDWKNLPGYWLARIRKQPGIQEDPRFEGCRQAIKKLNRVLPVPLMMFLLCMVLVLCGVKMPAFVMTSCKYIGNMVTPLSLIYTGAIIMRMILKKRIHWQKGYLLILLGRFALSPCIMIALSGVFQLPELMKNALIMQAAMPVMASTPIAAGEIGSDEEYAAGAMALSTLFSLIVIPMYMFIL